METKELDRQTMHMIDLSAMLVGDTISIERPLIELFQDPVPAILLTILMQRQAQCSAFDGFWPLDMPGIIAATRMNKEESDEALSKCAKYIRVELRKPTKEAYANVDVQSIRSDVRKALIAAASSKFTDESAGEP